MTIIKCYVQEYGILLLRLQQCGLTTNEIRWENWTPEEEKSDAQQSGMDDILPSKDCIA